MEFNLDLFKCRLSDTIAYCTPRADIRNPKDCLRTLSLPFENTGLLFKSRQTYEGAFQVLFENRMLFLKSHSINVDPFTGTLSNGRLLVFYVNLSLFDGATPPASDYFFDESDLPAWDTWVYYGSENQLDYLICWIPASFIELVQNAINVNSEQCLEWLIHSDLSFVPILKAQSLIE